MIIINNKKYILDKYYEEHEKPSVIAKELDVHPSYITKVIKADTRYIQEKEYRAKISKENRKISKREWIRNKRQNDADKELFQIYLGQFAASGIDVTNINSGRQLLDALNAACDLLKAAILMEI